MGVENASLMTTVRIYATARSTLKLKRWMMSGRYAKNTVGQGSRHVAVSV